jgi:hypothetical protein
MVRIAAVVPIRFTLFGQAASKANSRRLVKFGDRLASVKSKEALAFERDAIRQIPAPARQRLAGPVCVTLRLYYASERPDLDESLVLDVLQDRYHGTGEHRRLVQAGVYCNDRQVREKHVYHAIDRLNPRVEVEVMPVHAQQAALALEEAYDADAMPF